MDWETVIGLEVHVQLRTRSKLFCACPVSFGDVPNSNVCPVCLGLPGALPVLNREAVGHGLKAAIALDCTVHDRSVFERKSYFYPDLPKGYQITQFAMPLATDGSVDLDTASGPKTIGIQRLHLEEDAGRSIHDRFADRTAVDFNRSGVPLAEIVTEPDLRSPADARAYLSVLKQLLQYLGVSDCNMEEGSLRVDANLSVRRIGEPPGVKQELKNLNSFSAVERGLTLLRTQQVELLETGHEPEMSTYSFQSGSLRVIRGKEDSTDYRYFPDPDLPPLLLSESGFDIDAVRESLPELPWVRRQRFEQDLGLEPNAAGVVTKSSQIADYFEALVEQGTNAKNAANWVIGPVLADVRRHDGEYRVPIERLSELVRLVDDGVVSPRAAKEVFTALADSGDRAEDIVARLGLVQVGEPEQISMWVQAVLEQNADLVERYRNGDTKLLGFFMGRVLEASGGKADPAKLKKQLEEALGSS